MKKVVLLNIIIGCLFITGCDEQRDLYGVSHPLLYIEADWEPSLSRADMSQNATAVFYKDGQQVCKEYFLQPNCVTTKATEGVYDVLLFNGLMYSPEVTHLDNIYFCNTEKLETFEACAQEAAANKRLVRTEGEIIASNEMELLTSAWTRKEVKGEDGYYVKYENGKNGFPVLSDYVEDSVFLTPRPVSYEMQIFVEVINPSSNFIANGALRGFAGSVCMSSKMPTHKKVTHQLRLNNFRVTDPGVSGDPSHPKRGLIESPIFVTFGPPVDDPERKYEFELSIVLSDGTQVLKIFDVTDQIKPIVEQININLNEPDAHPVHLTIPLNLSVELPDVIQGEGGTIGVNDWGDDEIIRVPIKI